MTPLRRAIAMIAEAAREALRASRDLYVVMIPVIVAVKLLQEFDLVRPLAAPLAPLMRLVGLPADMGLAWAAGLLNGVYSGLIVLIQLAHDRPDPLTVAQVTTLSTMLLFAHALPVECGIAHRCGARFGVQAALRFATALLFGVIYHALTNGFGLFQTAAAMPLPGPAADPSLAMWALGEARNLVSISLVIFVLMLAMKLLRASGALRLIERATEPLMRLTGISRAAAPITVVGMTLGLSYGSGVILDEVRKGTLAPRDVFSALSLMGVCHSLIEDTLLMLLIGAELGGLLWLRLLVAITVTAVLVRVVRRAPDAFAARFLWVARPTTTAAAETP